jgi:hypothetical protein
VQCEILQLTIDHVPNKPLIRKVFQPYISIMRTGDASTRRHTFTISDYDITSHPPVYFDQAFELGFDKTDELTIELFNDSDIFHPHQLIAHATFDIQDLLGSVPTINVPPGTPLTARDLELPLVEAVGKWDRFLGRHTAAGGDALGKVKLHIKLFKAIPTDPAPLAVPLDAADARTDVPADVKPVTSDACATGLGAPLQLPV